MCESSIPLSVIPSLVLVIEIAVGNFFNMVTMACEFTVIDNA